MKEKKEKQKPPYQNEYPFAFDDKVLEQIGFAAGGFQMFLDTTPCAKGSAGISFPPFCTCLRHVERE